MIRFVHVSDIHIHASGDNKEAKELLGHIKEEYFTGEREKVSHLLVTGDIIDDGHDKQLTAAVKLLEGFRKRLLVAPGNHDYGVLGNFYDDSATTRFDAALGPLTVGGNLSYATEDNPQVDVITDDGRNRVIAIGLNSCLKTEDPTDFACGQIEPKQLDGLKAVLAKPEYANDWKLVYLHHRPLQMSWYERPFLELRDARAFRALVESRADVVAFGHSGGNSQELRHTTPVSGQATRGTFFIDANSCVAQKTYFEVVFEADRVQVNLRSMKY